MRDVLLRIRRTRRAAWHTMSPVAAREAYRRMAEVLDAPRAELPRVEDFDLPAHDGVPLAARLYASAASRPDRTLPALLFFHGGGFVIGDLETHDSLCRQLALRSGAAVVALDYRLAPEHRFPTAVQDAFAALRWLQAHGVQLGLDAARLAVGGDSAGGTLATVTALQARDAGIPLALQLLITPGTGARLDTASHRRYASGYLLDTEDIAWFFDQYIDPAQRSDWRFAPLQADDLEGVAPACLVLAECDPVLDEALAWGDRLRAAGVPVTLELYRGVTHDFIKMSRALPEGLQALQAAAAALKEALQP